MTINQIELQRIKKIVSGVLVKSWNNKKSLSKISLIIIGVQELSKQIQSSRDPGIKQMRVMDLQKISVDIVNRLISQKKINPLG